MCDFLYVYFFFFWFSLFFFLLLANTYQTRAFSKKMSFTFGTPSTSGFGGFGTTTNTTPTSGAAPATSSSGFTFNNTGGFGTTSSTSGFTLGTSAPTSTAPTTGFSFNNSNTQQSTNTFGAPASSAGFSFGTPASTTGFGFGQQQQQQNKPSLFGGSGFGSTGLGSSIQTLGGDNKFGSSFGINSAEQQKKQRDQQIYKLLCDLNQEADTATTGRKGYEAKNVWQALALLKSYYDPKSPYCRFRHYFYNVVNPQEIHLYQKPADHDPEEWTAAQKANPDPKT
jgi:nuclear pore complex protein Nup54